MKRRKRTTLTQFMSLAMTAVMLLSSNSIAMAAENAPPNEETELSGGMGITDSQNSAPDNGPPAFAIGEASSDSDENSVSGQDAAETRLSEVNEPEYQPETEIPAETPAENAVEEPSPQEVTETAAEPRAAETEGNFEYNYDTSDNTATLTGYTGSTEVTSITIPDTISGYTITKIDDRVFQKYENLTSVTLPKNLVTIGNYTFENCTSLETLKLPDSLTRIGRYAFRNCSALREIVFNESLTTLEDNAFSGCQSLTAVRLPASLTTAGSSGVFASCENLVQVTFAYGMETIPANICRDLSGLQTITYEGNASADSKITRIGSYAFYNCTSLSRLPLPDGLTSIESYAFYSCRGLTEINFPASLQTIGDYAFRSCSELPRVRIPASVTSAGSSGIFNDCPKLEQVTFAYGMETIPAYICRNMSGLKTIIYEKGVNGKSGITAIGNYAFASCTALTELQFPDDLTEIGTNAFYQCSSLTKLDFPKSLLTIGNSAFYYCSGLTDITLPEGLQNIGGSAFQSCNGLTQVRIPASLAAVESNGAFPYCSNLEQVTFAYGMETIPAYTCRNMTGLKTIIYEGSRRTASEIAEIGDYAFAGCTLLDILELPENLTLIGKYAFSGCSSLTQTRFPEKVISIEERAFSNCGALSEIILPESLETIGNCAFQYCNNVHAIYIGRNLSQIGNNAFQTYSQTDTLLFTDNDYARSYTWSSDRRSPSVTGSIYEAGEHILAGVFDDGLFALIGWGHMRDWTNASDLPWKEHLKSITNLSAGVHIRSIGNYMLAGSAVTDAVLDDSLESIGRCAFDGCDALTYIEIGSGIQTVGAYAFRASAQLPTILYTQNSAAVNYNWSGSRRILTEPSQLYKLGKYITAYLTDGALTIRGYGDMPDYSSYTLPWANQAITSVTVMKGIRHLSGNCFYNFSTLLTVRLPSGLRSMGDYAFSGCTGIREITLPKGFCTLGRQVFSNCSSLISINLEVTDMAGIPSSTFENCTSLRTVRIPASTERIEDNAFKNCSRINSLVLSEGVSYLGRDAFYGCENIKSVTIPRSLTSVGSNGNSGPFGTSGITSVSFAARTRAITPYLFQGCTSLTDIRMPQTVSEIGSYAFFGCTGLKKFEMTNSLYAIGDYAFYGCANLENIQWIPDLQSIGSYAFYECSSITALPLLPYLETIGKYAFYGCAGLSSAELGESLSAVEDYSFYGCGLKTVNLPYKISRIGTKAFAENSQLSLLTIPARTRTIADDCLENVTSARIGGMKGSEAENFATRTGLPFQSGISAKQAELSQKELTIAQGTSHEIALTILPVSVTEEIVWESSDPSIVSVSPDSNDPSRAMIRGSQAGQAQILAKAGNLTASCTVTVGNYITAVTLNQSYVRMTKIPDTVRLNASFSPGNAPKPELVWKTSDKNVATVDETGLVTSTGNGTARITVAAEDHSVTASCFIHVTAEIPVQGIRFSENDLLLTGKARKLQALLTPEDATNKNMSWESSDPSVASVDGNGTVTPVTEGQTVITVTTEDGQKTASCTVTVEFVRTPVTAVTLNRQTITLPKVGASEQLNASVQPSNADCRQLQWFSKNDQIASVDADGTVTARGGGVTTITARTKDGGYEASCQITVKSLIEKITLDHTSLTLAPEETAQITAVLSPYNMLTTSIEWYSTNTGIVQVNRDGLVTAIGEGSASVKCRSLDGTNITAACQVTVNKNADEPSDRQVTKITLSKKTARLIKGGTLTLTATVTPADAADKSVAWTSGNPQVALVSQTGVVIAVKAGTAAITVRSISNPDRAAVCTVTVTEPAPDQTPAKVKITSVKPGKKRLTVKWKKVSADGYQIQCSLKKNFSSKKNYSVTNARKTQKILKKLKSKKKYYVRIRAYKTVNGQKITGAWSNVKHKKVK